MKVFGIVAEYNPFHTGHKYHIEQTRKAGATHIAVVMSGNYVQRGDFAIFSKWARAEAALRCGADLVVELPTPYAMATAEKFAENSVFLLNSLGFVSALSFGSECGEIDRLSEAAGAVDNPQLSELLKSELKNGIGFAAARENAVRKLAGDEVAKILKSPNNILAVEYIRAIKRQKSKMLPITVSRAGAGYHSLDTDADFLSATAIRKEICDGTLSQRHIPKEAYEIFKAELKNGNAPCLASRVDSALLAILKMKDEHSFSELPDLSEGIENRLIAVLSKATSFEEIQPAIATKRYTKSRVDRLIFSAASGLSASLAEKRPPYIKILALNSKGREILQNCSLPIISKPTLAKGEPLYEYECKATDLFALSSPIPRKSGLENLYSPVYID